MHKLLLICTLLACWLCCLPEAEAQKKRKNALPDSAQTQPVLPADTLQTAPPDETGPAEGSQNRRRRDAAADSSSTRTPSQPFTGHAPDIEATPATRKVPNLGRPYGSRKEVERQLKKDHKWRKEQWKKAIKAAKQRGR